MVTIATNLADMKLGSSGAIFLNLGGNLPWDFGVIYIFVKTRFSIEADI